MRHVLVVNAGSSSLKLTLFSMTGERLLAKGMVERIGLAGPALVYERAGDEPRREPVAVAGHDEALARICAELVNPKSGVIPSLAAVEAVGHRVVHGGERFRDSCRVTPDVKLGIRACEALAPLHNPANLGGIEACERAFPAAPQVAVFDTAFHHSMPPESFLYAMPRRYYEQQGVRKYGFHGTSHRFAAGAASRLLGAPLSALRLITCHLGNGSSITAVQAGEVLDTSMGMTPLGGLVMGTRGGDIDPGAILYLLRERATVDELDRVLNRESGMLALAGSSDMRDAIASAERGEERAAVAIRAYVHRLVHYIGAYFALMGGADAIVFTGGVGENSSYIRERVLERLGCIGCRLDPDANRVARGEVRISAAASPVAALVIPANEELMIARETVRVLGGTAAAV